MGAFVYAYSLCLGPRPVAEACRHDIKLSVNEEANGSLHHFVCAIAVKKSVFSCAPRQSLFRFRTDYSGHNTAGTAQQHHGREDGSSIHAISQ